MNLGNPIKTIDTISVADCPSSFKQLKSDISEANAGRTEDGKMHKLMLGTNTKCEIGFQNISVERAHTILNLMKGEYHWIEYIDLEDGTYNSVTPENSYIVRKEFYVGDRSFEFYSTGRGIVASLTFSIIQRDIT